ncbi:stress response transcriptional regulator NmlR [Streptococcus equinus]|uniref:DNA-binding transcriptional regulator, MerR family n=1 Tax=Streptococcus equinus TaxID=1335 RepID=A0A1G9IRJ4_STREI|nr:stress response transcriptional regulator NmlR [Streptococcus equinus]SDL27790.1 DNA-binding transcriptional regulator, MerR family [Streptococcus equinus]
MNIKKVSEQTGVSADTIRYYERIGLLPRVRRNKSGIRDFSEQDIATLEFIRCFRRAGMSVESLIEYMNLVEQGEGTEEARMHLLQEQRDKLDARIDELLATRNRMDYKIKNYQNILLEKENVLFDEKTEE